MKELLGLICLLGIASFGFYGAFTMRDELTFKHYFLLTVMVMLLILACNSVKRVV